MGLKAQRGKPITGIDGMIGETGEALDSLQPAGKVRVHGEIWNAVSRTRTIDSGEKVRIAEIKDLTLYVEPVNS
jgi:membrane-bound serine protease (ClpP class)